MNNSNNLKYFLYARKSSEGSDRQIQSIDDQVSNLKELAIRQGIEVKEILTESKSAKKPGNRPVFDAMLARIQKGEANGILCWQINRLTRNPIDSGKINWMLQQSVIKSIQTIDKEYLPEDNVLMFSVESGSANQFIIDLRRNSRRGMIGKADRGWLPSRAPLGYLNDKLEHIIVPDPERFDVIRKMWDMMLTGAYSPAQVLEKATFEWGLKTPKWKNSGNKNVTLSGVYKMFSNIFYTGLFDWNGKRWPGKHKPMITMDEFEKVQKIISKRDKQKIMKHYHPYTGIMRCEECDCLHTATTKFKTLSNGDIAQYNYYYCTRKKKSIKCTQKKTLTEKELEKQIAKELSKIEIHPKFLKWALDYLNERNDTEIAERQSVYESQQKAYDQTQKELDNLSRMYYRELIEEDLFVKEKKVLTDNLAKYKLALEGTEVRAKSWLELTQETFEFVTYARKQFLDPEQSPERKREIFIDLGWNRTIKDKILCVSKHKWLLTIENNYPPLKAEYDRLEPMKEVDVKRYNSEMTTLIQRWGD